MKTAIQKMNTQLNTMAIDGSILTKSRSLKSIFSLMAAAVLFVSKTRFSFATKTGNAGITKFFDEGTVPVLNSLRSGFLKITTPLAGLAFLIALLIRIFAKNPRTVEEATVWAKRIFITYIVIVLSNFLFNVAKGIGTDLDGEGAGKGNYWTDDLGKTP